MADLVEKWASAPPFQRDAAIAIEEPKRVVTLWEKQPIQWAREFLQARFAHRDHSTLVRFRSEWWAWNDGAWRVISKENIESLAYDFLGSVVIHREKAGLAEPMRPNSKDIAELVSALRAKVFVSDDLEMPCLFGPLPLNPETALACPNAIVNLENGVRVAKSPLLFSSAVSQAEYLPAAPKPQRWLRFLRDVWGDDAASIELLQEWIGLCLTADTSFQKILVLVGAPRSGKGIVSKVIENLVGRNAYFGGSFSSLESNFGLWPLIGKLVAFFPDVRLGERSNSAHVVERLLNISGADNAPIDRKNLPIWNGRLKCRIIIGTNEFPNLRDESGAMQSRFLTLPMRRSFLGQEDLTLGKDLEAELPGILIWAIGGLRRLKERGRFAPPPSSAEFVADVGRMNSPTAEFVSDELVVRENASVPTDLVFKRYLEWCAGAGLKPESGAVFGRNLRAACPNIARAKKTENGDRRWCYIGLNLKY